MRVHELAKKAGVSSKVLQDKLKDMGIKVKSHMSVLDEKTMALILAKPKATPSVAKAKASARAKAHPKPKAKAKAHPKPSAAKAKPKPAPAPATPSAALAKPAAPTTPAPEPKPAPKPAPALKPATPPPAPPKPAPPPPKEIVLKSMLVGELAKKLQISVVELIKKLIQMNVMATINQYVSEDTIRTVCKEYGFNVKKPGEEKTEIRTGKIQEEGLVPRPPVVTVMGHVDHGKTSLLDAIRKTHVAEKEIGAITQHIGAYKIKLGKGEVVFLDTPGHAAFTAMRARGASVTDIIVLVVAADDGIMPQTVEAIDHARAAKVPIVVVINKIDRPNARAARVKQELMKYELTPEELGGKTICAEVSAVKKIGIENLLEMLLLEAELLELKANPSKPAKGIIIEAKMDKKRGAVATVLVQEGTLNAGDVFVAGLSSGKIRAMTDERGNSLSSAPPSTPVEILGFPKVPYAGDSFEVVSNEKAAQEIILERRRQFETKPRPVTLGNLYEQIKAGAKELKLIIKADVRGSVDALSSSLQNLGDAKVGIRIIHKVTGDINESDVILASASQAIIIGFNVGKEDGASELAEKEGVDIRSYQVIYNALNDIKNAMSGLLEPVYKDVFTGRAEVRQIFTLPNERQIAGCYVVKGKILRGAKTRIMRGREKVFEGKITSLKRFKNDARDVQEGYECGIGIEGFKTFREGDLIEVFVSEEVNA